MKCANCGEEIVQGAEFCGNCGAKIVATPPQAEAVKTNQPLTDSITPAAQPAPVQPIAAPAVAPIATTYAVPIDHRTGFSITSLVTGIVSLLTVFFIFPPIILGIVALVFGILGLKRGGKGMAIAGLILGGLAIAATTALVVFAFWLVGYCDQHKTEEMCKSTNKSTVILQPLSTAIGDPARAIDSSL